MNVDRKEVEAQNIWGLQFQLERTTPYQQQKRQRNLSASYLVDLANTCQLATSITDSPLLSGGITCVASGAIVGQGINMINSDSYLNVFAQGLAASGQLRLQVQTADADVSGQYTDPTSGLPNLPGAWQSGGILWINSGGAGGGVLGGFVSGQAIASGWAASQALLRPGTYARLVALLEGTVQYGGSLTAGFISQFKTTGSGGGFSYQPGSGTVNV